MLTVPSCGCVAILQLASDGASKLESLFAPGLLGELCELNAAIELETCVVSAIAQKKLIQKFSQDSA